MESAQKSLNKNQEAACAMLKAFDAAAVGHSRELVYITLAAFIASNLREINRESYETWWTWFRTEVDDAITFSFTGKSMHD